MVTCYEFLQQGVNREGSIVYYGHKLATKRFLTDIERICGAFGKLGLAKGDVITLYLPSCPQSLAVFYACSKMGLVANVIHPLVPVNLLAQNLQKTHSKMLLYYDATVKDERPLSKLGQILVRCSIADYVVVRKPAYKLYSRFSGKRLTGVYTYAKLLRMGDGTHTELAGKGEDVLCFMHSGGTSGAPKIVKLTNNAFQAVCDGMVRMYHPDVHKGDCNLATLPVFHAYGLCSALHGPLSVGYDLIIVPKFDTRTVARCIDKYNVKVWSVVPAMLKKMLADGRLDRKGLKKLDVIWCGGDVCEEDLVDNVDKILSSHDTRARLMRGYGLTEMCGVTVVNNFDFYKKGTCGRPMPGFDVQIWDEEGNALPCGEQGEIALCGGGAMSGYVEGDDCLVSKQGRLWVTTGDMGYLDEEGYLHFIDRKKRSLKIAAVNVFPAQIESCVKKIDYVSEVCAVGVKVNGKPFVKVYVTLSRQVDAGKVKEDVVDVCRQNLMRYAVPAFVEVVQTLPRTPLGKVDYKALEKLN